MKKREPTSKAEARSRALGARRALSAQARARASRRICRLLAELDELASDRTVASFWPMWDEVDIRHFTMKSTLAGRTVCLPRVVAQGQPLAMHNMSGSGMVLTTGYGGVSEPSVAATSFPLSEIASMLVPSASVDAQGNRLGMGLGFYDITISAMPNTTLIAPLFSCQIARQLPAEPHDLAVDIIVTEDGVTDLRK